MSLMNPQPPLNVGIDSVNTLEEQGPEEDKWIKIAREIYEGSTDYLNANLRFSSWLCDGFFLVTIFNFLFRNILFESCTKKELSKKR